MVDDKTSTVAQDTESLKTAIVQDIMAQLREQEVSINKRNVAIDKRYQALYGDGLMQGLPKKAGFDSTQYNFVRRIPEIMKAQLMGRGFSFLSTYDKEDLSVFDLPSGEDPQRQQQLKEQAEIKNGRLKADADLRVQACKAIIEDNGGMALFNHGAKLGSYSGITIYKRWADSKKKRYNIVLLENPNNFWRKWSDSDFREWDWSAYCYQISESAAYKQYGDFIKDDENFTVSKPGSNIWEQAAAEDINNLPQKMVWVIDLTGSIQGWTANSDGSLTKVKRGKEEDMSICIVGGKVCHVRNNDLPKYTVINNLEEPLNPWGVSDISDDAISINQTIMQVAQFWVTLGIKSLFYKLKFKNFTSLNIPKNLEMEVQGIPMDADQDIELIQQPQSFGEFERIIDWLINSFVRVTRIGRVMFDDPTATSNSNQAMMTSMKGLIDTIEDKQSRWTPALIEMFTDALNEVAPFDKALQEAVNSGDGWRLRLEYPSILRREDATYQQMWNNIWNSGIISPETYMEKMGVEDPSEELDRIKDALADPTRAAMMGRSLGMLAGHTINKSMGIPPWGYVVPKIQLRGDLTPQQEGNLAQNYGWNDGPYGSSMGPQGAQGTAANDNFINDGQINGNPFDGGVPAHAVPHPGSDQASPTLTPDQNTGTQAVSQPGSGATGVSPQGAINQLNQRAGK